MKTISKLLTSTTLLLGLLIMSTNIVKANDNNDDRGGSGNKPEATIAPFTKQSCNPLDGMGCDKGQRCGKEATKAIFGQSCSEHEDCGGGNSFCAQIAGSGNSGKFCVQRAVCETANKVVTFPAYYENKIGYEVDLNKCTALLTENGKKGVDFEQKELVYTTKIDKFTEGLAFAEKELNDYFGINRIGQEFSLRYINGVDRATADYLKRREELEERMKAIVESNEDVVSSVPYYQVLAELYSLDASKYQIYLSYLAEAHGSLNKWAEYVNEPHTGNLDKKGLKMPYMGFGRGDEAQYHPAKATAVTGVFAGVSNSENNQAIPQYQLIPNICGNYLSTNRYCVKRCETASNGAKIVDPIIASEKIKRDILGKIGCSAKKIGAAFGLSKKCPKNQDVIPDIFQEFGKSSACAYQGPETKIHTLFEIRETMAYMTEFYSAAHNVSSELSRCMIALGERFSSGFIANNGGIGTGPTTPGTDGGDSTKPSETVINAYNSGGNLSSAELLAAALSRSLSQSTDSLSAGEGTGGNINGRSAASNALNGFNRTRKDLSQQQHAYMRDIKLSIEKQDQLKKFVDYAQRNRLIGKTNGATDPGTMNRPEGYTVRPYDQIRAELMENASALANLDSNVGRDSIGGHGMQGNLKQDGSGQNALGRSGRTREKTQIIREQTNYAHVGSTATNSADNAGAKEAQNDLKPIVAVPVAQMAPEGPEGWNEYDTARMLDDLANDQTRYSRRSDDSIFEIITKTYMRSAIPTFFDNKDKK